MDETLPTEIRDAIARRSGPDIAVALIKLLDEYKLDDEDSAGVFDDLYELLVSDGNLRVAMMTAAHRLAQDGRLGADGNTTVRWILETGARVQAGVMQSSLAVMQRIEEHQKANPLPWEKEKY